MKITTFKNHFFETIAGEFPKEEISSFYNILTQEFLGQSRLDLALNPQRELSPEELGTLEQALQRLKTHEPIQYIIGNSEFYGLDLEVNKHVLIPRPETEELVEWILQDCKNRQGMTVLDIGTGSGCIAISLAKHLLQAKVYGLDVSEEALKVARTNANRNGVEVAFSQQDILKANELPKKFDIIVSNPPYVREQEKKDMQRNVLDYEPETALYVKDDDPLLFYRKIAELASINLEPGGKLYFEINQYLGKETEALLVEKNFQTRLKKDIFGVDRVLRGNKL